MVETAQDKQAPIEHLENFGDDLKIEKLNSSSDDVHYDEAPKYNEDHYATLNRADIDGQLAELDQLAEKEHSNKSFFERIYLAQVPISIKEQHMVLMLGIFASFAGILSGLDQSIISGAKIGLHKYLQQQQGGVPLTDNEASLIDSLMPIGAITGSLMMTPLNHVMGRRGSIIISCLWYTVGGILCAAAFNLHTIYVGRFFLGIGIGIEGGCVGIYISESVPARVRGSLVSLYQFNIALGEVIGYAVCAIFFKVHPGGWRFMLGSSLVFSTILLIGLFFLPESPRWLVAHGKVGEAWHVWKRLRNHEDPQAQIEFLEMRHAASREREVALNEKWYERYLELVRIGRNRRALIYAVTMVFLGQMTGVNGILYNMSTLMSAIGFDELQSVCMSISSGSALMLGAIPGILFMDKFGRRTWAQNLVGFFVGLILVGVGSLYTTSDGGVTDKAKALGLSLAGMYLYMGFFGTYACLTWVIPAESFSLRTRSQGMAICSASLYLWSFIVTYNFSRMTAAMKYIGLMIGFFGGLSFLGFIYQLLFMPETKDRTLEEIDDIFSMKTHQIVAQNMRRIKARISTFGLKSLDDLEGRTRASARATGSKA